MKMVQLGASGQVGYALMQALVEAGHDLTVLVRAAEPSAFPASVRVVVEESFTSEVFDKVLDGVDCAVYGIGLPEQFALDPDIFDRVNHGLLTTFLQALDAAGVRRLVYISTYEVFAPRDGVIKEGDLAAPEGHSPYIRSMIAAYSDVTAFAQRTGTRLTTIHPAAVYGGRNTGDGFTAVLENLIRWRLWRLPMVPTGRFPLVHADSLAAAVVSALSHEGPFIISDAMCDLPSLARGLRRHALSYVPVHVPAAWVYAAAKPIEGLARALRRRPIMSAVQLDFIAAGNEPLTERAQDVLGFAPLSIDAGLRRYLTDRAELLRTAQRRAA